MLPHREHSFDVFFGSTWVTGMPSSLYSMNFWSCRQEAVWLGNSTEERRQNWQRFILHRPVAQPIQP